MKGGSPLCFFPFLLAALSTMCGPSSQLPGVIRIGAIFTGNNLKTTISSFLIGNYSPKWFEYVN